MTTIGPFGRFKIELYPAKFAMLDIQFALSELSRIKFPYDIDHRQIVEDE